MKLIIDIPEETKQAFDKAESNDLKGGFYDHGGIIGKAIQNGTLLDDVKEKIAKLRLVGYADAIGKYEIASKAVMDVLDSIGKGE